LEGKLKMATEPERPESVLGRSQFQWLGFEHEAKEFLVRFSFKDDRFSVETIVKKDFIWGERSKASVSNDEAIVNISDMLDEQMMIGEKLVEGVVPDLFADGYHHKT
jgi:hypothetical protein